jgi:putative ABC transport system permease protein
MMSLAKIRSFLRNCFRRDDIERDLDDELQAHLDLLTEQKIQEGMSAVEARRAARIEFGGIEQTKEQVRTTWSGAWFQILSRDLLFGLRVLRKNPGFLCICIAALALGIGLSTAVFSILYAVVLKPFPFPGQDRIVIGWQADPARRVSDAARQLRDSQIVELSYLDYRDWRAQSTSFEGLAAVPTTTNGYSYILTGQGEPRQLESSRVSDNYFSVLAVTPFLGRTFRPEDDRLGANPVVVLTYEFWRTQFHANPSVIDSGIELSGVEFTIVGVLPPQFVFPEGVDIFTLISVPSYGAPVQQIVENRGARFLQIVGRLKPGISLNTANAELNTIVARIAAQHPETKTEEQIAVIEPLRDYITGTNKTLIYLLFAGSLILLLVAWINLASLLVARAIGRTGEIVVRVALGATKKQLFRQFLVEGLLLAMIGTAGGIAMCFPIVRALVYLAPREIPRIASVSVSGPALLFTLGCLVLTMLVYAITPIVLMRSPNLESILRESSASITGSSSSHRLGRVMLILEISSVLALVVLAGTVGQSFRNLQNAKLGYDADRVYTCAVFLNPTNYPDPPARRRFFQELMENLQNRPEVLAAGAAVLRPLEGPVGWYMEYTLPGQSEDQASKNPRTNFEVVTPSYFRAIGTPLIIGRSFEEAEDGNKPRVTVVSESVARAMYGTPSRALGQHFKMRNNAASPDWTIIGIVGDARYRQLNQVSGDIFVSYNQSGVPLRYVIVRTNNDPAAMAKVVREEISKIDPSQADGDEATMSAIVNLALARDRFNSKVLLLFSAGALLLAAIGTYGVVSDSVATRTRELGIRIALGAEPMEIMIQVLRSALTWVLLGEFAGLGLAIAATSAAQATLFGVSPVNMPSIFAGCAVLIVISLIALVPPVLRAARTDPNQALRQY